MLCSRPQSHESVIFFVFLAFIVLRYGRFVEYINNIMHAMSWCSRRWLWGRFGLCTHACRSAVSRVSRMLHLVIIIITIVTIIIMVAFRMESKTVKCTWNYSNSFSSMRRSTRSYGSWLIINCLTLSSRPSWDMRNMFRRTALASFSLKHI